MEEKIYKATQDALAALGADGVSFAVEWPGDIVHGDFAVNAALAASKTLGKSPKEIAELLAPQIHSALGKDVESVSIAGPGFINIRIARSVLTEILTDATHRNWGKGTTKENKRILIEYSCPNPFKQMHIGHLMSTVIGESVARLIENQSGTVTRDTYGGDVGPHVAKTLWALRNDGVTDIASASQVDEAYVRGARAYEESEQAKAEIDALNTEIYAGTDTDLMTLWRACREVCLEAFRGIYRILGTTFDYYFFESEVTPLGMRVVQDALARGIFEESEGAIIYKGEKKGLHTLVFVTSRGTPTYEAKDIGLAFYKEERIESDENIIETGVEQVGHFKVFLAALEEIAPALAQKTSHISHGLMTLTTGKMSSREGNVVTAAGLLTEVIARAKEKNDDPLLAEQVAVAAIKYMILRSTAGSNIMFDPEKSLSLEGDSGPYLQYALVRARSVLAKDSESTDERIPEHPYLIERLISRFPKVVARSGEEHAPHHLVQYLTQLASEWNSFYAAERIVGGEYEVYKRTVAEAFIVTMENGLALLGIPAPVRM